MKLLMLDRLAAIGSQYLSPKFRREYDGLGMTYREWLDGLPNGIFLDVFIDVYQSITIQVVE